MGDETRFLPETNKTVIHFHVPKNKKTRNKPRNVRKPSQQSATSSGSQNEKFTNVPPEIFINICRHLTPAELLKLARVCRTFNRYLASENSTSTDLIWQEARLSFLPALRLPPPGDMSERNYVRLVLERGCQMCNEKGAKDVHIQWQFMVRCCRACFKVNTESAKNLLRIFKPPEQLWEALPNSRFFSAWPLYWKSQVKKIVQEFKETPTHERSAWIEKKAQQKRQLMDEFDIREDQKAQCIIDRHEESRNKRCIRQQMIDDRVTRMEGEQFPDGSPKFEEGWIRSSCKAYRAAIKYTNPLTERAWSLLRQKIEKEYVKRNDISDASDDEDEDTL